MAGNPDLAQKLLASNVQDLWNAAHVARALLARYAAIAPKSAQAQAFTALDCALKKFNAWVELTGNDPDQVQTPTPPLPEKIEGEKAAMLG